jgi:DNA-3-methyladenine glycosylase I
MIHPYCNYTLEIKDPTDVDKLYHDTQYGVPINDDNELFGRLVMEINQAGLSWRTILMKEKGFRNAYHNFTVKKVAKYGEEDFTRLMNDTGIIRNRLKINAAIYNAQQIIKIQKEFGSFKKWLDVQAKEIHHDKNAWVTIFKKQFKFTGGEIVGEFLMSINLLYGAHDAKCKRYKSVLR